MRSASLDGWLGTGGYTVLYTSVAVKEMAIVSAKLTFRLLNTNVFGIVFDRNVKTGNSI